MRIALATILVLSLAAAIPLATAAETYTDFYGPAVGVWAVGASGAFSPGPFKPTVNMAQVTVTLHDDAWDFHGVPQASKTYFNLCIEKGGQATICGDDAADISKNGINSVTLAPTGGIPAGTNVNVFVYSIYVGGGGPVAIGTTGVATATFS